MSNVKLDTGFVVKIQDMPERNELDEDGRAVIDPVTEEPAKAAPEVGLYSTVRYEFEETGEVGYNSVEIILLESYALTKTLSDFRALVKAKARSDLESFRGKTHMVTEQSK